MAMAEANKTIKRDAEGKEFSKKIWKIPLDLIHQKKNSRVTYGDSADLAELMASMKNRDLLSPIGVQPNKDGTKFELIWGNRRYLAAKKLGWKTIDAVYANTETEEESMIVNAIENMQREDVPLAEQGRIFAELVRKKLNANEIAARVGVHPRRVKRALELFYEMPQKFRDRVIEGTSGQQKKNGKIPERTAFTALKIANKHKLVAAEKRELFEYASRDGVAGDHLRVVAGLMKNGVKLNSALRKASSTRIVTLMVAIDKDHAKTLEEKHNVTIHEYLQEKLAADKSLEITFLKQKIKVKKKAV
jgi:ParB/RepB/Spo0J family partition protein